MPDPTLFGLFVLAALTLLLIPGPTVLFIVSQSLEGGRRAGLVSTLGAHCGSLVHVAAATIGLSSIVVASSHAYQAVKYVGAAYLIALGLRMLLRPTRNEQATLAAPAGLHRRFVHGALVNVFNPKTAVFFVAFLPQFVEMDGGPVWLQVFVLGLTFVALGLVSDSAYALLAGALAGRLRRGRVTVPLRRWAPGSILVGLGIAAAVAGPKRAA